MSMINRYNVTKEVYKEYIVLIYKDHKYYSFDKDKKILDLIGFNNKINILRDYGINFIILDDLEIIGKGEFKENFYHKYLSLSFVKDVFIKVKEEYGNE